MHSYFEIFNIVLPVFGVIALGVLLRRLNCLTMEADKSLTRLTINVLLPSLIFESLLGNEALKAKESLLLPPLVGIFSMILGYCLGYVSGPLWGSSAPSERRTFSFTVGTFNYGYIPVPLALALFDHKTLGVLFLYNGGVEITLWTMGVGFLTGSLRSFNWKSFVNAPVIAILLALALSMAGLAPKVPHAILNSVTLLGQAALPLAFLLIGATISDFWGAGIFKKIKVMLVACFLRLLLLPLLFILMAKELPCSIELKRVIVLQAAMPAAVLPIVMTKHYGEDVPTALAVVFGTSLVGMLTIPFWINWGLSVLVS